jgi:uncharacterized protein
MNSMKKQSFYIISIFLIPLLLSAQEIPKPIGWVNDFAGVIDSDVQARINSLAQEVKDKTGNELAVVTVKDMGGLIIEEYAPKLFSSWSIGEKEKDNGGLILLALHERKVRIEVGYGLEGLFTDARCGEILDQYVVPELKQGNYGEGLYAGLRAMAEIIALDKGATLDGSSVLRRHPHGSEGFGFPGILMIALFILLAILTRGRIFYWLFLASLFGGGRRGGGWGGGGGGFGGGFGGFGSASQNRKHFNRIH